MEAEILWLTFEDVCTIHELQLKLHGGPPGFKDDNLVQAALAAPVNLHNYSDVEDPLQLGIRLCFSVAQNHGFVDGNKRAAAHAMIEFLSINGWSLKVPEDIYTTYENVEYTRLAWWVRQLTAHEIDEDIMYELLVAYVEEIPVDAD